MCSVSLMSNHRGWSAAASPLHQNHYGWSTASASLQDRGGMLVALVSRQTVIECCAVSVSHQNVTGGLRVHFAPEPSRRGVSSRRNHHIAVFRLGTVMGIVCDCYASESACQKLSSVLCVDGFASEASWVVCGVDFKTEPLWVVCGVGFTSEPQCGTLQHRLILKRHGWPLASAS